MVWFLTAILAVCSSGQRTSIEIQEQVDFIELNHFYNDMKPGEISYSQVIFWEWSPDYSRHHVVAWFLVEGKTGRMPIKEGPWHVVRWYDRDLKTRRAVRSKLFRETHSTIDPERANKKLLDEKYRSSLRKLPK